MFLYFIYYGRFTVLDVYSMRVNNYMPYIEYLFMMLVLELCIYFFLWEYEKIRNLVYIFSFTFAYKISCYFILFKCFRIKHTYMILYFICYGRFTVLDVYSMRVNNNMPYIEYLFMM